MNSKYRDDYLFKVIIAIKINHSKLLIPIKLTIEVQDKKKICSLPLQEGQFFDFTELNLSRPIKFLFHQEKTGRLIGHTQLFLPNEVLNQSEYEISQDFQIDPTIKDFQQIKGSYYIIVQNKQLTLEKLKNVEKSYHDREFETSKQKDNDSEKYGQKPTKNSHNRSQSSKSPIGKNMPVTSLKPEKINKKPEQKKNSVNEPKDLNESRNLNQSMEEVSQSLKQNKRSSRKSSFEDINKQSRINNRCVTEFSPKKDSFQQKTSSPSRSLNQNILNSENDVELTDSKYDKQKKDDQELQDILQLRKQVEQFSNMIDDVQNQKDLRLEQSQQRVSELEAELANQQNIITQQIQEKLDQLEAQNKELERLRQADQNQINDLNQAYTEQQRAFQVQFEEMKNRIRDLEQSKLIIQSETNIANKEIIKLKSDLAESQQKQYEFKQIIEKNERSNLYSLQTQAFDQMFKSIQDQFIRQKQEFSKTQDDLSAIKKQYDNAMKDTSLLQQKHQESEKQHLKNNELLRIRLTEIENKCHQQQNVIDEKNQQITQLNFQNKVYQRDLKWLKDVNHQIEDIRQKNSILSNILLDYQQKEESLQKNQKELNIQLSEKNQEITKLGNELKEAQDYAYQLKTLILEMKENGVCYIPFHQDPIDKALGEFINSLNDPERLKNLFFRESEGVYLFGTRKIFAKLEQDRLLVRTGGGYIGMEEFLDLYASSEIEKMEKHDPKKYWELNQNLSAVLDQSRIIRENARLQQSVKKFSPNK